MVTESSLSVGEGKLRLRTLNDIDGRSPAAHRANLFMNCMKRDLGGADRLSTAEESLIQRAALIDVMCEDVEASYLLGEPIELPLYLACINALRRTLATVGLRRPPREMPGLQEYMRTQSREAANAED